MTAITLSSLILAIAATVLALYLGGADQPQRAPLRSKARRIR
jgi:hypothetical protein